MATKRPPRASLAVGALVLLALTGCSQGLTDSELTAELESTIVTDAPHLDGVNMSLAYSGASQRTVVVQLYADTDDATLISTAMYLALSTIWAEFPSEPATIGIAAIKGEKPLNPPRMETSPLNPAPFASLLGIDERYLSHGQIILDSDTLADRYGEWTEPAH